MIKILSKDQIREADRYTVAHEPVATIDLMERAAESCLAPVCSRISPSTVIRIFCGPGNNGGDGLALARMLYMRGYSVVVYGLGEPSRFSSDRSVNTERFTEIAGERYVQVRELLDVPVTGKGECWVDALFGTGNSSASTGIFRSVIDRINSSGAFVVSIDLPSGSDAAAPAQDPDGVVRAAMTLSFQSPKLAFLIPDTGRFAGEWIITDIGLHPQFLQNVATDTFFFTAHDANDLFKRREKFSHKGTFGHALLFAGSHGTTGAAVLASRACLRSGVGLLTTHVPAESVQILQTAAPEAMVSTDADAKFITGFTGDFARFSAIGIGPGIGTSTATADLLLKVLASGSPLVVDADALNILSADKRLLDLIPKGTVLTPHPKEFERLTQPVGDGFERLRLQREFARKYSVTVVLKGSHTCTVTPDGTAYFNSTGNAGLARGGSGDILTGMILSFLSQGYPPEDAARLGVYLHGAAADAVASRTSMQGMLPSDVVEQLPRTFGDLEESAGDPLRYRS